MAQGSDEAWALNWAKVLVEGVDLPTATRLMRDMCGVQTTSVQIVSKESKEDGRSPGRGNHGLHEPQTGPLEAARLAAAWTASAAQRQACQSDEEIFEDEAQPWFAAR